MGYALNLCNTHISVVPYNQNIGKEGIHMAQDRVRIADVADSLGLSTATVSKVIHRKTEKISDETVTRPAGAGEVGIYPEYGSYSACQE